MENNPSTIAYRPFFPFVPIEIIEYKHHQRIGNTKDPQGLEMENRKGQRGGSGL